MLQSMQSAVPSFKRENALFGKTPVAPTWDPFWVDATVQWAPRPFRSASGCNELEITGVADRLRAAAFAEVQAEAAFLWAAERFKMQVPEALCNAWRALAVEERKHRDWLLARLEELNIPLRERPVSDALWHSLTKLPTPEAFCHYMAGAEERGRRAGERFGQSLAALDPQSARIFAQIAKEETRHIELAYAYYPLSFS